jgi:GINS complex subunit 1
VCSEDDSERKKEDLAQLLAQHTCLERNKRCLLAYVKTRADELLRLRWECGTSVLQPHLQVTEFIHDFCLVSLLLMSGRHGLAVQKRDYPSLASSPLLLTREFRASSQEKVSQQELNLIKEYDNLLSSYIQDTDVAITDDLEPPKSTKITVRVLQDVGEWSTEDGFVDLSKDTVHHVNRSDVQHLIRQGLLLQIS